MSRGQDYLFYDLHKRFLFTELIVCNAPQICISRQGGSLFRNRSRRSRLFFEDEHEDDDENKVEATLLLVLSP
jgi:hypothetical protein